MEITSIFTHNNTTFAQDTDGNYWLLTPVDSLDVHSTPINIRVKQTLTHLGMPQHLKGFDYIVDGVCLLCEDPTYSIRTTYRLLPEIAKKNGTTASRVERAIRHIVDYHCDITDTYLQIFGIEKDHIPCKEFLISLSKYIKTH